MADPKRGDAGNDGSSFDMSSLMSAALADAEALVAEKDCESNLQMVEQVIAEREASGEAPPELSIRGMTIEQVAETRGVSVEALAAQQSKAPVTSLAPQLSDVRGAAPALGREVRAHQPSHGSAAAPAGQAADAQRKIERLEARLAEVRGDLAANRRRFQRFADRNDEVQARMERQQQDLPDRITQQVIEALLPVFDGLDTVVGSLLVGGRLDPDERTALEMLVSEYNKALQQLGIQTFDAVGHMFDPTVHEAISEDISTDVAEGCVARQVGRGYLLRGRLMRSAQVVIARLPPTEDAH